MDKILKEEDKIRKTLEERKKAKKASADLLSVIRAYHTGRPTNRQRSRSGLPRTISVESINNAEVNLTPFENSRPSTRNGENGLKRLSSTDLMSTTGLPSTVSEAEMMREILFWSRTTTKKMAKALQKFDTDDGPGNSGNPSPQVAIEETTRPNGTEVFKKPKTKLRRAKRKVTTVSPTNHQSQTEPDAFPNVPSLNEYFAVRENKLEGNKFQRPLPAMKNTMALPSARKSSVRPNLVNNSKRESRFVVDFDARPAWNSSYKVATPPKPEYLPPAPKERFGSIVETPSERFSSEPSPRNPSQVRSSPRQVRHSQRQVRHSPGQARDSPRQAKDSSQVRDSPRRIRQSPRQGRDLPQIERNSHVRNSPEPERDSLQVRDSLRQFFEDKSIVEAETPDISNIVFSPQVPRESVYPLDSPRQFIENDSIAESNAPDILNTMSPQSRTAERKSGDKRAGFSPNLTQRFYGNSSISGSESPESLNFVSTEKERKSVDIKRSPEPISYAPLSPPISSRHFTGKNTMGRSEAPESYLNNVPAQTLTAGRKSRPDRRQPHVSRKMASPPIDPKKFYSAYVDNRNLLPKQRRFEDKNVQHQDKKHSDDYSQESGYSNQTNISKKKKKRKKKSKREEEYLRMFFSEAHPVPETPPNTRADVPSLPRLNQPQISQMYESTIDANFQEELSSRPHNYPIIRQVLTLSSSDDDNVVLLSRRSTKPKEIPEVSKSIFSAEILNSISSAESPKSVFSSEIPKSVFSPSPSDDVPVPFDPIAPADDVQTPPLSHSEILGMIAGPPKTIVSTGIINKIKGVLSIPARDSEEPSRCPSKVPIATDSSNTLTKVVKSLFSRNKRPSMVNAAVHLTEVTDLLEVVNKTEANTESEITTNPEASSSKPTSIPQKDPTNKSRLSRFWQGMIGFRKNRSRSVPVNQSTE